MPGMVAFSRPHPIVLLNRLTTGWSSSSEKQTLSTKSRAILESIYGVFSHFPKHYTSLGVQDRNVEEGIFSDSKANAISTDEDTAELFRSVCQTCLSLPTESPRIACQALSER